ncbi:MAG: hypothetical protein NTV02_02485 [Candidatus Zambryskibacteria bacterium]|nr:hypothetical protein [Candidatus Zambryskibacteria bacterium]
MRTIAAVCFLLMVLSISTPANAQEPLSPMPTVILLPQATPKGVNVWAIVFGPCVGRVTVETGIQGAKPLEIPPLTRFKSVLFELEGVLPQGENTIRADVTVVDQGDCASPPVINPVKFLVGTGEFGVNDPRLASGISLDKGFPWLNFEVKSRQGVTYGILFQLFPNGSNSTQQFLFRSTGENISTLLRVNGSQMDVRLPFFIWMIAEDSQKATVTVINPTVN